MELYKLYESCKREYSSTEDPRPTCVENQNQNRRPTPRGVSLFIFLVSPSGSSLLNINGTHLIFKDVDEGQVNVVREWLPSDCALKIQLSLTRGNMRDRTDW